jgi:2'-5' RNA ligase
VNEQHTLPAFPATLPQSLTDPAIIAEHDWHAFCQVDALRDHWDRPGWTPGRRSYHWFLTLADQAPLIELAQRCQQSLAAFGFDLVASEALHLTLCRVGFTDQVTERDARSVAEAARRRGADYGLLRLIVGPLAGSSGALRFTVSPWAPLMKLHDMLTETTTAVLAKGGGGTSRFRPHVGIAYSNRTIPASVVREAIRPLRRLPLVQVSANAAHLVVLRREQRAYRWERFETLRLAGKTKAQSPPTAARPPRGALGISGAAVEEGSVGT